LDQVDQDVARVAADAEFSSDDALADLDRNLAAARLKHAWMTASVAEANAECARVAAEIAALEAKKATLAVAILAVEQGHLITMH
jgi:septal ring factor EnvC (AmiA/AmiB activator)